MNQARPSFVKPALIGGVAEGVAGAIPILNMANAACCILVIGGGFLAAYLYMKNAPPSARAPLGDGLKLGLLTGLFGAMTFSLITIPLALLVPNLAAVVSPVIKDADLPEQVVQIMSSPVSLAVLLGLFSLIIDPIFCGIGSLIGVAIFNKTPAASESPLDILKARYARGEIDKDEYDARRNDLS